MARSPLPAAAPLTARAPRPAARAAWGVCALLIASVITLGAVPASADGPTKALDEYFRGRVSLEKKTVTIKYDFRDKEQLKDFVDQVPWPIEKRDDQKIGWFDEQLEVVGNSGARHVAHFTGAVQVKVTVTLDADRDIGGWLEPLGDGPDYATFTLHEHFFHTWNGKTGGQHSVIKFGEQWRERGASMDFVGFRYIDRRPPSRPLRAGDKQTIVFGLEKGKLFLETPDFRIKGNDRGKKLKVTRAGFYAIKGRALFDNVEITGTLDPKWMRQEGIALEIKDTSAGADLDDETRALVEAHKEGDRKATRKLMRIVSDEGQSEELRGAVVGGLAAGPKKTARAAVDLLYSEDLATRTYGIQLIETLLGDDYGYRPKASEKVRRKAIQSMNQAWDRDPSLLED